jgi:hypothetical protein
MAPKNVLVVLSSHGQLGSTGNKTGWYLVRTHLFVLSPVRAILMIRSRNLPIHTMFSLRMSNSLSLPQKAATLHWILALQRPSRMTLSVPSFCRPNLLSGRIPRSSRPSSGARASLTPSSTLEDMAVRLTPASCVVTTN